MAFEAGLQTFPAESGELALSASQYKFVQQSATASKVLLVATAGDRADGVLQDAPLAAGNACLVAGGGITKVVAGMTLTPGQLIESDTSGRAVTAAAASTHHLLGRVVEGATVGLLASIILDYQGRNSP